MKKISVCLTFRNRAKLFKYNLEGLLRQTFIEDDNHIEVCILDTGSTDGLYMLMDRYSEHLTFRYARATEFRCNPNSTSNPCIGLNTLIKYLPKTDKIIKTDAEIVMLDEGVVDTLFNSVSNDKAKMYNVRTHFTEGEGWYNDFDDIRRRYEQHYHFAEGGPFSRSKYYFCSGFSRQKYLELGGVEELFRAGTGYDDNGFRDMWKNRYGSYEVEVTGRAVHLWHGPNRFPPTYDELNRRVYEKVKHQDRANQLKLVNNKLVPRDTEIGCVEMLSKIYTISNGTIIDEETPWEGADSLELPFG